MTAQRAKVFSVATVVLLLVTASAWADVTLPHIYSDHMVVQRDKPFLVHGWADPGEQITIELGGGKTQVKADENGLWKAELPAMEAGGPHTMTVAGNNTLKVQDILVGEVWVCSGQSNMERPMYMVQDGLKEIKKANHPRIRFLRLPHLASGTRETDAHAKWSICDRKTANHFSAIGYFFGRELQKELDVPIGLIDTTWGATRIEVWTPVEGFDSVPDLKAFATRTRKEHAAFRTDLIQQVKELEPWVRRAKTALDKKLPVPLKPRAPQFTQYNWSALFNGMVAPLTSLHIRGVLWYQGENNVINRDTQYDLKMKALITGWRQVWNQGDFPFYYVQLAPYHYRNYVPEMLPLFWEQQTKVMEIPNTGMAVINDIGNLKDIHPLNKHDVAHRLALWALAKAYDRKDLIYSGPLYKSMSVEGDKIRIRFDHIGSGLAARDGKPLTAFTIAGADKTFVEAVAVIEKDSVVVSSPTVKKPTAVRFAWHQDVLPNLMNKEGLPANSFRTDDWKVKAR